MTDTAALDDARVAAVLATEARDCSRRYSTLGVAAFRPQSTARPAQKPNTRFLSHLLRDTDAHNAALLAREQREARERRRALQAAGDLQRSSREDKFGLRHDDDERRPKKRRRADDDGDESGRWSRHRRERSRREAGRSRSPGGSKDRERRSTRRREDDEHHRRKHRHHRSRRDESDISDDDRSSRHRSSRHSRRDEDRNGGREDRHDRHRARPARSDREASPRQRSRTETEKIQRSRHDSQSRSRSPANRQRRRSSHSSESSDPLDDIIGPTPASASVRVRGRGAQNHAFNAMDARFDPGYNPRTDVQVESDEARNEDDDEWEMALEALRDRQKWRLQGADRLKAAGFSAEQVDGWQKASAVRLDSSNDDEQRGAVRWARAGEGREWDRGKVVVDGDDDGGGGGGGGSVELRAAWARPRS